MRTSPDLVAAIVVAFNRAQPTIEAITSLNNGTRKPDVVLLVDNSTDEQEARVLHTFCAQAENIRYVRNQSNTGFAAAVNRGIGEAVTASANWVFLLNDDAVVAPDALELLLKGASAPDVAAAGPTILFRSDPQRIWLAGGRISPFRLAPTCHLKNQSITSIPDATETATFLTGCALLISTDAIARVGFFDERLFMYEEDFDYCLRLTRAGYKMIYVPHAHVWHSIGTPARTRSTPLVLYHMAKSRVIVLRKSFRGMRLVYALFLHVTLYSLVRMFRAVFITRSAASIVAWVQGTVDGLTLAPRPSPARDA